MTTSVPGRNVENTAASVETFIDAGPPEFTRLFHDRTISPKVVFSKFQRK